MWLTRMSLQMAEKHNILWTIVFLFAWVLQNSMSGVSGETGMIIFLKKIFFIGSFIK